MTGLLRTCVRLIVRVAGRLLPSAHADWSHAMRAEAEALDDGREALAFAIGCLAAALRLALTAPFPPETAMPDAPRLIDRPQALASLCALAAVLLGIAHMAAAGAPVRLMAMNLAALGIGFAAFRLMTLSSPVIMVAGRFAPLVAAGLLLATALFGLSAEGITRWVMVGGILLQPGQFIVPALALAFARRPFGAALIAIPVAAFALALQPDRALAGALAAATIVLLLIRPTRGTGLVAATALLAAAVTQMRADPSPAVPHVDQILFSAFDVHPLAGLAVWIGSALMLVPALVGIIRDPAHRAQHMVFGAVWLAMIAAAALANFPTPLVGFGGSAILGYMISIAGLPRRVGPKESLETPQGIREAHGDRSDGVARLATA